MNAEVEFRAQLHAVRLKALEIYKPEGVEIWLNAPAWWLDGLSPVLAVALGRFERVMTELGAMTGQVAT